MANKTLFDESIDVGLDANRLANSTKREIVVLLKNLERELSLKLLQDDLTDFSKKRTNALLLESKRLILEYYSQIQQASVDAAQGIALASSSSLTTALSASLAHQATIVAPTTHFLETIAKSSVIQGGIQSDWWIRQENNMIWQFNTAIRQGMAGAESRQQIINRVRDVMAISKRNAEALVRTAVMTVSNNARQRTFDANADVMGALVWNSALDSRVCNLCLVRDGREWDYETKEPIGHTIPYSTPPIHFGDRCSLYARTKTFRELGIDLDEVNDKVRASAEGQVTDLTFEDYMNRKGDKFMDGVLGKGRAEMYRDKKISLSDLLDSDGNELTLKELKEKYS